MAGIDPEATQAVPIRCVCDPNPDGSIRHPDGDTVNVRSQYGYGDTLDLSKRSVQYKLVVHEKKPLVLPYTDAFAQEEALLEIGVKSWTLEDANSKPVPVALPTILLLPPDVGELLSQTINGLWDASKVPVPNGSSAPSPGTPSENGSARPNRATRRSRKHSTPS